MSNVIKISKRSPSQRLAAKGCPELRTSADYRRLLREMRRRPPSQRAFLRKFLQRAACTGVPIVFPVHNHVVLTP